MMPKCPLCTIADQLIELSALSQLIDPNDDASHDKLKSIGDALCAVLDEFDDNPSPWQKTQH
jgi:hypothetical protein